MDEINGLFNDDTKIVLIAAGMGGRTGSAVAPVIANAAKNKGILTVGVVTIPFRVEGMEKIKNALKDVEEMRKNADTLLVINNEQLIELYPDLNMPSAFAKADEVLIDSVKKVIDALATMDVKDNRVLKQTLLDTIDAIDSPLVTKE